jgi:hypothetical protein
MVKEAHSQGKEVNIFEGIKQSTHDLYKDLYLAPNEAPVDPTSYPLSLVHHQLKDEDNRRLMTPINLQEIKKVFDNMEADKAPGPYDFTTRFYKACWPIIKKDLLRIVQKSQNCLKIGGRTNSAFLALIPKEKWVSNFSQFCPISLYNTSYKLVTKIIATRLKDILPGIILENQGGFIKGHQILDNIVLVQEALHSSTQCKEKGTIIKLDLANSFDRVRHDFLFQVMRNMGFVENFISWIKSCIATLWISPLVNGRSTHYFQASRGLRQGFPCLHSCMPSKHQC